MSSELSFEEANVAYRSWSPAGFIALYEMLQKDYQYPQHLYPLALALCDWRINRLMMIVGPGSGKSTTTSQVFPGAVLARNPTENIVCVAGAEDLAQGFQQVVMSYFTDNEGFRQHFPEVKPDKPRGWSNSAGMFVTGHRPSSPDASFWSAGISSRAITGKHGTVLIFDDLHTEENSLTEDQCQKVVDTYVRQLSGRQDPRGARFIITGRRWHEKDLYGTLKDNGDWVVLTLPAERPESKLLWYDITVPDGFDCVFTDGLCFSPTGDICIGYESPTGKLPVRNIRTERKENGVVLKHMEWVYGLDPKGEGFFWPDSKAKREEYFSNKRLSPTVTEAVYQCNPNAKQGSVFLDSDFDRRYTPVSDQELGVQNPAVAAMCRKDGSMIVQAWDTAFSANASSDHSVCATLLLTPCEHYHRGEDPDVYGPCERHFDILILDIWRGRVDYAGVERQMRASYHTWKPQIVIVENKAYGVTAIENLQSSGMPIEAVTPGALESKRARAVEGVSGGSVQGWCRSWRVCLPTEAPWVEAFLREMKDFTGVKGGTDDQVDALVHGVRWAIQNGGGADLPSGWADPGQIDNLMRQSPAVSQMASMISSFQSVAFDPFGDCCGRCRHYVGLVREQNLQTNADIKNRPRDWCLLHGRPTQAIGSCDDHREPDGDVNHPFWNVNY